MIIPDIVVIIILLVIVVGTIVLERKELTK